jgi:hypothetical protein
LVYSCYNIVVCYRHKTRQARYRQEKRDQDKRDQDKRDQENTPLTQEEEHLVKLKKRATANARASLRNEKIQNDPVLREQRNLK